MELSVADMIWMVHTLFVLWVALIPFVGGCYWLELYAIALPFLWLHWMTNDDTCALTLLESNLRGISSEETFMSKLISPVYKFQDQSTSRRFFFAVSYFLWVIAVNRLYGSG